MIYFHYIRAIKLSNTEENYRATYSWVLLLLHTESKHLAQFQVNAYIFTFYYYSDDGIVNWNYYFLCCLQFISILVTTYPPQWPSLGGLQDLNSAVVWQSVRRSPITLYTQEYVAKESSNDIYKFADNTPVVDWIMGVDESEYRRELEHLVECCHNNLSFNVNKTKEQIIDFRKRVGRSLAISGGES